MMGGVSQAESKPWEPRSIIPILMPTVKRAIVMIRRHNYKILKVLNGQIF